MPNRRDLLKFALAAGGAGLLERRGLAADPDYLKYFCLPDGLPPDLGRPSPPATPFRARLPIPPVMQPVPESKLNPPPDPNAHQRYNEFRPKEFYEIHEREFSWCYHPDPPYSNGTISWGFAAPDANGNLSAPMTPGPIYHARYGEPILVRRFNDLPPLGESKVTFACPSTTSHLHNGHTASESDGYPSDYIWSGEFWDHHYCNFPSHNDAREKLCTLWYHDHREDFTAANVYAGLGGFYFLFDEQDTGNENDTSQYAWRLPSGKYDVPLMMHDVLFDSSGQVVFNTLNTDGILGDRFTVNRTIQPFLDVERRKYRFRIYNGGPSRFYQLHLDSGQPFIVITGDGNFLQEPVKTESIYLSVAQRVDVILDFSGYKPGQQVVLINRLEQVNGRGPSGRTLDPGDQIMAFNITDKETTDNSRIPDCFRCTPPLCQSEVKRHRVWTFDYMGGCWTVNGKIFRSDRVDAGIEYGTAEMWTLRNDGKNWSHPIHSHFTEFLLYSVNGKLIFPGEIETSSGSLRRYEFQSVAQAESAGPSSEAAGASVPLTSSAAPPPAPLPEQAAVEEIPKQIPEEPGCPAMGPHRQLAPSPKPVTGWFDPQRHRAAKLFMGGRRRDVATLNPNDELIVFMRWADFYGKYVMHCHNVVHEDHAMMIRWDIVPAGQGFVGSRDASEVEKRPELTPEGPPGAKKPEHPCEPAGHCFDASEKHKR